MSGTTVLFPLLDRLVEVLTAALPEVKVVDGDAVYSGVGDFLYIGWDDPTNDRAISGTVSQSWAGLGARARDEEGTVTCFACRSLGGNDLSKTRARVKAVLDQVEQTLRADPNLGGLVPGLLWTGFGTRLELSQWLSKTDGSVVVATFDIAYKARI